MNATPRTPIWVKVTAAALLLALALVLQPIPAAAQGTSYTVTRFDDPDPPGPCFASDCSLREAVIAANSNAGADFIFLPAGDYFLSAGSPGDDIAVGGDLDITDDLTIVGDGPEVTFISMISLSDRVFHIPSSGYDQGGQLRHLFAGHYEEQLGSTTLIQISK